MTPPEPVDDVDSELAAAEEAFEAADRPLTRLSQGLTDVDDALADLRARLAALDEPVQIDEPFAVAASDDERPFGSPLSEYTRPMPNAWLFRDQILVNVGPFADLVDVDGFAESLSQLPPRPRAAVWGFDGNQAVIRLTADEPLRLADADLRTLPYRPRVTLATPSALTLRLELPPLGRPRADEGPVLPLHVSK